MALLSGLSTVHSLAGYAPVDVDMRFGDRVEPVAPERVAPTDAAHREPTALRGAVQCERLVGVRRARGCEPARRRTVDGQVLVRADRATQRARRDSGSRARAGRHGVLAVRARSSRSVEPSSAYGRSAAPGAAPIRYVCPGAKSATCSRHRARRRRRNRLRTTALPIGRPIANATRGGSPGTPGARVMVS